MSGKPNTRQTNPGYKSPGAPKGKRDLLMSTLDDLLSKEDLLNTTDYTKADIDKKFEMLQSAIVNINNKFAKVSQMFNDEENGLNPRLVEAEESVYAMEEENKQLRFELEIAKGIINKQDQEISIIRDRMTAMTARSMRKNITISGLVEKEQEVPKEVVKKFFSEQMNIQAQPDKIKVAHRIGLQQYPKVPRLMVVKLDNDLKDSVLKKKPELKEKTNEFGKGFYISKQIPDEWAEQQRELNESIRKAKAVNDSKEDGAEKDSIQVKNRNLYINKEPQKKLLAVPKPAELFVEKAEQDKIDRMKLYSSDIKN